MATLKGDRSRYRLEGKPLGEGGYARVFAGVERDTGRPIAFKRAKDKFGAGPARMKREVRAMIALEQEPNVMDVLDAAADFTWYVMPRASSDLGKLGEHLSDQALVEAFGETAAGLGAAHALGFVHRDVLGQKRDAELFELSTHRAGMVGAPADTPSPGLHGARTDIC